MEHMRVKLSKPYTHPPPPTPPTPNTHTHTHARAVLKTVLCALLRKFAHRYQAPVARKPRKAYGTRKWCLRARKASRKF